MLQLFPIAHALYKSEDRYCLLTFPRVYNLSHVTRYIRTVNYTLLANTQLIATLVTKYLRTNLLEN